MKTRSERRDEKAFVARKDKRKQDTEEEKTKQPNRMEKLREDVFALSSRARSYYRHTWCNILPLIFASVRGFLLWPWRDFTLVRLTLLGMRQAVHRHRRKRWGDRKRQRATMIECCQSLRRVVRLIHPSSHPRISRAPFRFLTRTSSFARAKEVRAKDGGLFYARDRTAGIVVSRRPLAFLSMCYTLPSTARISSIRVSQ